MGVKREAREYLITARTLFNQGDYEGSLIENQKVLSLCTDTPPADEALFNIGVIHAHYGYSKRDYKTAIDHFKRVVKGFPQSPFAGEAKTWIEILQEIDRLTGEIKAMQKEIEEARLENGRLVHEIEELSEAIESARLENEELTNRIEELNKIITKSKQVDIEIERKRRRF
jgi:tetratricopeptide (TPR) repeat protein